MKQTEIFKSTSVTQTFSGELTMEDFNTSHPNPNRISALIQANNLRRDLLNPDPLSSIALKYKDFTIEELREMKVLSNTDGRPTNSLTDDRWQIEFRVRKNFITPFDKSCNRFGGKYSVEAQQSLAAETKKTYDGTTNWQQYSSYINDVLDTIRAGQIDYCYFIYQILDLLKFHYDDLCTRYCDGYWEVWLDKKNSDRSAVC